MNFRNALLLRSLLYCSEVSLINHLRLALSTKLLGTEEYEIENSRSERDRYSLGVYWKIQKLVAFVDVFLGAYLCQILKEMNLISLGSFAFLVHVLI